MRRHLLGVFALMLIAAGSICWLRYSDSASGATFAGSAVRIGIVLAALWLAWRDLTRWNPWLTAAALLGVALVVVNIRTAVVLAPVLLGLWLLWKRQGGPRSSGPRPPRPQDPNAPPA